MVKKRIIILGAGLAGLSAAWHLQKKGIACRIFEKEPEAGGLCRSKQIGNFTFDYDGHLLHFKNRYTFSLVKSLLGENLKEHKRNALVYSFGRYTRFPFQANLYGLPPGVVKECLLGLWEISQKGGSKNKKNGNFLDWINNNFGKGIAKYFMTPYNAKFWTLHPRRLNCLWLDGFIPKPTFGQIIEGSIENNQKEFGYNTKFWYPEKGGIGQLTKQWAAQIKNININSCITGIDFERKELEINSSRKEKYDYLISTIPLPELPKISQSLPSDIRVLFRGLRWNSIFNLNLGIENKNRNPAHWIYFPQKEISFFRLGFFHNFSSNVAPVDKNSLYAELSYSKSKPIDRKNIVLKIKNDLVKTGIINSLDDICLEEINDIKYGYPIYDANYVKNSEGILSYLKSKDVTPCGRYGSWHYFSMEDAILDGKRAAEFF